MPIVSLGVLLSVSLFGSRSVAGSEISAVAQLDGPGGMAGAGSKLLIVERLGRRILDFDPKTHSLQTVAGSGEKCCITNGLSAGEASLEYPVDVAVAPSGDIFVADTTANLYEIEHQTHRLAILALEAEPEQTISDNFHVPRFVPGEQILSIAIDPIGSDLYIVGGRGGIYRLREGVLQPVYFSYDPSLKQSLTSLDPLGLVTNGLSPSVIAIDKRGDLYIADDQQCRIFRVQHGGTVMSVVAGSGKCGVGGDGGPAIDAAIGQAYSMAIDRNGDIYFSTSSPSCVRRIEQASGRIESVPGMCRSVTTGGVEGPSSLALDGNGTLFLTYYRSNKVVGFDLKKQEAVTILRSTLPERRESIY